MALERSAQRNSGGYSEPHSISHQILRVLLGFVILHQSIGANTGASDPKSLNTLIIDDQIQSLQLAQSYVDVSGLLRQVESTANTTNQVLDIPIETVDDTLGRWDGVPVLAPGAAPVNGMTARCPSFAQQFFNRCPIPDYLPRIVPPPGGPIGAEPALLPLRTFTPQEAWQAVAQGEATLNNTLLGFLGRFDAPFRAPAPAAATRNPSGTQGRRLHQNGNSYLVQGDFWAIRNSNMGVAPIHAQLTRYDKILMIDRRFYGSEAVNPTYIVAGEYDTQTNAVRNVTGKPVSTPAHVTFKQFLNNYRRPGISSNSWCSCGQALLGGLVINLGGGGDSTLGEQGGGNSVRRYQACNDNTCEINEDTSNNQADRLLAHRWYAAATLMPDGRILVTSGHDTDSNTGYHGDTFEIYPRNGGLDGDLKNMQMPINWNSPPTTGVDMNSRFLYPHVHLLPTGDWYLQQRNQWYVGHLEPGNSKVVKGPGPVDTRFSDGGTPTTYPSDGNSFLLPLAPPYDTATVVTCGATWSYFKPGVAADPDCIVITPTDATPVADRTKLKQLNTRIMVYCVYMLDGNLACLGGSSTGSAGYYGANAPVYQVDILDTNTMTFHGGALATVPRLYHGVATLIASGAIWTGGTNPQGGYQFQSDPANSVYPAELRAEVYYPWYFQRQRPVIRSVANNDNPHTYGSTLTISVQVTGLNQQQEAAIIFPGFSTHNQMYSQRYVRLPTTCARPTFSAIGQVVTTCTAQVPQSRNMAPPSDYLLTILDAGVPSEAVFIGIGP